MDKAKLEALLDRVERAIGWDSGIDKDILRCLGFTWRGMDYWHHDNRTMWKGCINFTASIDAALALVDRLKPISPMVSHELTHSLARDGEECFNFRIRVYSDEEGEAPTVYWATSFSSWPIAILAALLKALIAREA